MCLYHLRFPFYRIRGTELALVLSMGLDFDSGGGNGMPPYECPHPGCHADMTNAVCEQCKESRNTTRVLSVASTFVIDTSGSKSGVGTVNTSPLRVTLQCPNGHWAEYECSADPKL